MPKMVQLVYISSAVREFDSIDLTVLLAKAREKNERLDVSGMLVFHENAFLQVLEGEAGTVDSLYARIRQDDRHASCQILLRSFIDRRSFGDWKMGFVDTKLFGPKSLPGYSDFFGKRFSLAEFGADPSLAHKLLMQFREGNWRGTVEVESQATAIASR